MFVRSDLPNVRWVLPDSYLDVKNKTYAGEPFIDGQAVPYDPKYHEVWVRNREASLKSNARNKKRQREPNSSGHGPRPSSFASLPGTPSENSMPSDVSENQAPPVSRRNPERASLSVPSISNQNEKPYGHPLKQTEQKSQLPDCAPSALSHNQSQMQNQSSERIQSPPEPSVSQHLQKEIPSAHSPNQTSQFSQSPNRATSSFSHNQASEYPQMQNWSSGWNHSPREPAVSQENEMPSHHPVNRASSSFPHNQASQNSQMQNRSIGHTHSPREPENEMPSAHPLNQTPQPSQLTNPGPSSFSHNQASQYPQMQNWSSGWAQSQHEPSPRMHPHHQSWENQNQNWTPRVGYENQPAGGPSQNQNPSSHVFSENHTPHYSQMYTHPSPWTPAPPTPSNTMNMNPPNWSPVQSQGQHPSQFQNPINPPQPSPTWDSNYQSWGNQYQNQDGHPGQPAFSQSHTPEYTQMQNQYIRGTPQPQSHHSPVIDENHHNWNNHDWNAGVGPQSHVGVRHPPQMQQPPTPGYFQNHASQYPQIQYHSSPGNPSQPLEPSAWANPSHQSWSDQNQNWTYVPGSENQTRTPYHLQNQNQSWEAAPHHRSRPLQSHDSPHNSSYDYSYRDTSHGARSSQYSHPSNTFQPQAFQGGQGSNAVAPPQGWNHQNMMAPATQNNHLQSTNVGPPPRVHNHQFVNAGKSRSTRNDNFQYKMGDPNQVDNGSTMPSYSNTGDRREYQERDAPMDEDYVYGRR